MKKLLNVSLLLVAVVCLFASCSEDNDDDYDYVIEYSTLPTKAKTFVETHFSDATVTLVKQKYVADTNGSLYDVYVSTGAEIDFDKNGVWISIDGDKKAIPNSLFGTEIPTVIKSDANTRYPNIVIVEIEKQSYGYKIELANDIDLKYSLTGDFIGVAN